MTVFHTSIAWLPAHPARWLPHRGRAQQSSDIPVAQDWI